MKPCRLKIITSNIINDIDIPKVQYISKNKKSIKNIKHSLLKDKIENTKKLEILKEKIEEKKDEIIPKEEEEKIVKNVQLEELIKYDLVNNDNNNNNNTNNQENIEEKNKIIEEQNNIDINDLCTISNNHLYEEDYNSIIINNNNFNTISTLKNNFYNYNNNNNYPYNIEHKKKELNMSLRNIFKTRDKKPYMSRTLSCKKNQNKNKKSLIKNIITNDNNNKNHKFTPKKNNNNNLNKSGNILKININKSFCMNNNNKKLKNNNKNIKYKSRPKSKNSKSTTTNSKNSKNKSIINYNYNYNNNSHKKNETIKMRKNNMEDDSSLSFITWNIIEKNEQNFDYKLLIDDLLIKECQLVKEKENIIQKYEQKLKPLIEINNKYLNDNNEELDREDELRGELTILKNQYERLFAKLNLDKNKINDNLNNIGTNNKEQEEFNMKKKEIDKEFKDLNDNLKKGEILLVTKPSSLGNLSKEENDSITLMLKGLFTCTHIFDTDKIVDLIWKYDKKFQTIYFLVEELINFLKLEPNSEKDILIKYFYSFCKRYNYMNINTFKKEFKKKIGKIQIFNKYIYITKLLNFHGSKISQLIKVLKEKDIFNIGVIKYEQFVQSLQDIGLYLNSENFDEHGQDYLEFFFFCMKKDRSLNLSRKDPQENQYEIRYSLFDLYYEGLSDFIDEYNCDIIKNPFKLIRKYMKRNDINNVEYLLKPILNKKYILNVNNVEYIDIIILNKYLRKIEMIPKDEKISVSIFEEELIDKNKFINDIYDYYFNKKEETNFEEIKKKADNLIDDIFGKMF